MDVDDFQHFQKQAFTYQLLGKILEYYFSDKFTALVHVFCNEFCKNSQNNSFAELLWLTASGFWF